MTLDVAIATYGREGIRRVEKMLLPPQTGVTYVVSWQQHEDAPVPSSMLRRSDVIITRLDAKGLSNNRNNSIAHCTSDIVLIADDDLIYHKDSFNDIIRSFKEKEDMDFATFRVNFLNPKVYPSDGCQLSHPLPKGYWVTSMEIAFRRTSIGNIKFDSLLGLGAPKLHCGEEEMFVYEAIQQGLRGYHIGKIICKHPTATTGDRITPGILMGHGYVIRQLYPGTMVPRLLLKALRLNKTKGTKKVGFFFILWNLVRGAMEKHSRKE